LREHDDIGSSIILTRWNHLWLSINRR